MSVANLRLVKDVLRNLKFRYEHDCVRNGSGKIGMGDFAFAEEMNFSHSRNFVAWSGMNSLTKHSFPI